MPHVETLLRRLGGYLVAFVTVLALLPPVYPSVLCIAPGGHCAIEDLYSPCCTAFHDSLHEGSGRADELAAGENCRNCTDFLLSNDLGATPGLSSNTVAGAPDVPCATIACSAFNASELFSEDEWIGIPSPGLSLPSVPLRC